MYVDRYHTLALPKFGSRMVQEESRGRGAFYRLLSRFLSLEVKVIEMVGEAAPCKAECYIARRRRQLLRNSHEALNCLGCDFPCSFEVLIFKNNFMLKFFDSHPSF